MHARTLMALWALGMSLGCSATARLHPVSSPEGRPGGPGILQADLHFVGLGRRGQVSLEAPDGQRYSGTFAFLPAGGEQPRDLAGVWDQVYGPGYFVSQVLGTRWAVANLAGSRGGTLAMAFGRPSNKGGAALQGIARNGQGVVYKVVF